MNKEILERKNSFHLALSLLAVLEMNHDIKKDKMKWKRYHLFPSTHWTLILKVKLFWTKTDCTKALVKDTRESWSIPMVLGPKVTDEEGEETGLCGSPPPTGVHLVLAKGALSMLCIGVSVNFWSCDGNLGDMLLKGICFSLWISRKVTNTVQVVFWVKYRSAQPGSLAEATFLLIPRDILTSKPD